MVHHQLNGIRAFSDALLRGEGKSIRVDEFDYDPSIKAYLDEALPLISMLPSFLTPVLSSISLLAQWIYASLDEKDRKR